MANDTQEGGGGTSTLDRELEELLNQEQLEEGDHERFSHYVQKEKILKSALSGKPVIALCGKVWLPGRDPEKFPVCPTCKEIYDKLKKYSGRSGQGAAWPAAVRASTYAARRRRRPRNQRSSGMRASSGPLTTVMST